MQPQRVRAPEYSMLNKMWCQSCNDSGALKVPWHFLKASLPWPPWPKFTSGNCICWHWLPLSFQLHTILPLSHPVLDSCIVLLCAIKQQLHLTQRGMRVEILREKWCNRNVGSTVFFLLWARKCKCKKQIQTLCRLTVNVYSRVRNHHMQGQVCQGSTRRLRVGEMKTMFFKVILGGCPISSG